ncbi:MAG: FtsQ-type POTRA domain-containing protein [Chlorobiaceae bacterium]|nr:FtsQ-type POTRA domain-containing protein [Chlorobiaceae bacterium]
MPDSEPKEDQVFSPDTATQASSEGAGEGEYRYDPASGNSVSGKAGVFIVVIALGALAALAFYSSQWKRDVVVRDVVVEGVSSIVAMDVSSSMKIYNGRNLQELDPAELKKRIMLFPYVRDAVISKELNGIVRIRVAERVPIVLTVMDGLILAIDNDGFLFPWRDKMSAQFPKLLLVSGISPLKTAGNNQRQIDSREVELLRQFLEAFAASEYARLLIRELHLAGNNMTYFIAVQAPTRFIIGNDGNFKEKLKKFEIFWQKVISKKGFGSYETVDLRFSERIFTKDFVTPEMTQETIQ